MNKYALTRDIPSEIKRQVRQRCGFGCVVCGASIYEYDHFDPPYPDAKFHNPEGITLLCPTHHAEKTKGVLPLELVRQNNARPAAHRNGHTSVIRPYFKHVPALSIGGGLTVENTPIPIMVKGTPLIEFKTPEEGSDITRINAALTSEDGRNLLRIIENEWVVESGVWDYEWVGQRMTIRDAVRSVALQIAIFPPKAIHIDRLRFRKFGYDVTITQTEMRINGTTMRNCIVSNCGVGVALG